MAGRTMSRIPEGLESANGDGTLPYRGSCQCGCGLEGGLLNSHAVDDPEPLNPHGWKWVYHHSRCLCALCHQILAVLDKDEKDRWRRALMAGAPRDRHDRLASWSAICGRGIRSTYDLTVPEAQAIQRSQN